MTDWQPIETAPKDGEWLIGYHDFAGVIPICWCDIFHRWETPDQNFSKGDEGPFDWFPCEPTEWTPRPKPPHR